ncbi:hypothetical protein G6F46_006597 [Rhizopus delemar]|uniref:MARVEL domain-containing protein n=3 Tax=Rhizopus TaxID=4842 RepID=I1BUY6_RHIO9|nr:hypothetical protein RO3G_04721 [Rhizopus delemar RA 99-880]KAG1055329.1 hypothetical protein G6F43_002709 [Rhizopus delemar]KAG1538463.1 hypothetical protein G6F51_009756 [Rhizopus arrhizus]KAG1452539.1 hypothetical protein G6F55_008628 [Rhizopus delemar]KAG1492629.1 hypothetical protein G6F54_009169 [Rhizopus delemar]|eukprot:EIE80016.1 hypothetical protein RO3G_04721 [Rhizopus delemar RA 99-880]
MKTFVGPGAATCCSLLSFCGILFLVLLGTAFKAKVEVLTEFISDPDNPYDTAQACFTAAIVYACFLGFCGCQVLVHKYNSRQQIQL